jgi:hypothetical protein
MKIIQKNSHKRTVLIILIALAAISSLAAYWYVTKNNNANKAATEQVDKTSAVKPEQVPDSSPTANNDATSTLPSKTQPTTGGSINKDTSTPAETPETPNLTRADLSNGTVKVVATFTKSSPGYCQLQLTKSNYNTIIREANIVVGPSYYTCAFSIPKTDLPSSGTWSAVVSHYIGDAHSSSETRNIEIN